jgi:hypothetical protein
MRKNNLSIASIFLFGQRNLSPQRCIDFTKELERSLNLFNAGFLADYFSQIVAATTALLSYLFFEKAFSKPKRVLGIISLPIVYLVTSMLTNYLITDVLSYCF